MTPQHRRAFSAALARLKDGDRSAATEVFELAWPVVSSFARAAVGPDGDDAAQQALIKVFEQVMDYDVRRDALAWLLEVAQWECRSVKKARLRSRQTPFTAAALKVSDGGTDPELVAIEHDLAAALKAALAELTEGERAAVVGEIQAGVAPATWRKRRERALQRLKLFWRTTHGT